ncbi:MAG TPA: glycosyltransferase, partial [Clostridia bacterium]|nr:glycosyltransferase [Clostridia bacterium]
EIVRATLQAGDAFVFLAVGRLEQAKGFDLLIRAIPFVAISRRGTIFLIVGDGSLRGALEESARGLANVRFLGVRDDIPDLMAAADALVLSSRWEGLPMVLLEAASAGLPVIATDIGGVGEVVADQETGLLVPAGDVDALGAAMIRLAGFPSEVRHDMGKQAHRLVEERYSLAAVVDTWVELYAGCADRRRT